MALDKIIKNINVDFYDDKYILINAKQYDGKSRYINVTCYNQGKIFNLSPTKHSVYVKYKKPDENAVFNFCTITTKGQIEIELTEQMLVTSGMCYVDLVVINKGNAVVNVDTGEIITVENAEELGTMTFRVYVYESSVDNSVIESSDEYNGLTKLLVDANAEYERVIKASQHWSTMSQSYAIGGTNIEGRVGVEDVNNSKYYSQLSRSYAIGGSKLDNRKDVEDADNARYYSELSSASAEEAYTNAVVSSENKVEAIEAADAAIRSAQTASNDAMRAEASSNEASGFRNEASDFRDEALGYKNDAEAAEVQAKMSRESADKSAMDAMRYAIGDIGYETDNAKYYYEQAKLYTVGIDENDIDNAKWYYNEMKDMFVGLNIVFVPKGTISFDELATVKETALSGYVYNIRDDFTTDETFREGAGMSYTAGTNVYYTVDGYWDCFGGSSSPTATVDEIKEYLGI